ncbi:MAG TPA: sigma-70 family RNA polymerase sigma factor [Verrucomicrobiae bacterium]|jgi:RNA polymerase sigma factor (sigma-70 family)
MNESQPDFEWLQQFARAGDQNAFRDLVRRHLGLVFATAQHKVGDLGGAEEISQNVFSILARKAWQFAPDDSLPAWLHKTTVLESKSWVRGELRRRGREQTAMELGTTMKTPDDQPAFNALVPLLDEALLSLREKDRTVLLLRFYEKQDLSSVGKRLGVSEDAAQKRVRTALENVSQFFQRRGFRTATAAAAAAALQQTSTTVSAATVSLVAHMALQSAPAPLVGFGALAARLATLTKVQTAVVCLLFATVPVAWQWHQQNQANTTLAQSKADLAGVHTEFSTLQTEVDELRQKSAKMDTSLADSAKSVSEREAKARQFAAWKKRMREQLLSADYHWPDDSAFIRIPKSVLPQLEVHEPITQPGVIKQAARELLGLSPTEREQAEAALQKYFSAMDNLASANSYETNRGTYVHVPADALASQVFGLPALGAGVKQYSDELQASLQTDFGEERWPLMQSQLDSSGTYSLRHTLDMDAGENGQELAVWIQNQNGELMTGLGWGQSYTTLSTGGMALRFFLPGVTFPDGSSSENFMDMEQLPATLTAPALAWIRQQAEARLGTKGNQ